MKPESWKNRMQEYIQEHKLRKRWMKITASLGALAIIVTAAAMILPAITMENAPQMLECQINVHTHKDNCYDAEGNIVCGYADFVVHTHNDSCYAEDGTLICPLDEIEAHTHDASCYRESRVQVCGFEEEAGHVHDISCYQAAEPACGLEESVGHVHHEGHIHTEACYGTQRTLICTQDTGCYDAEGNLVCEKPEEGHTHTAECYPEEPICGKKETAVHSHTDNCYEVEKELICGKEEIVLHTHTAECFDENGKVICGMLEVKEHVHDERCIPQTNYVSSVYSWATVSKPGYTPPAENTARAVPNVMLFAAPQAEAGSYDFSGDITSVTVERQQGGQWTQSDTFTDGDTIRVTIRYTIPEGEIHAGRRNMYYQLPAGIALEREETGVVYLEGGNAAGTYTISTNGLISIAFDEAFANGAAFSGSFFFQGSVALADLEEDQEIVFGGAGGAITVVPEEKQYSLSIGKPGVYVKDQAEAEMYEGLNMGIAIQPGHLLYTVNVWSDDGSDGTITVTDQFTHDPAQGVVAYDEGNIAVFKITPTLDGPPSAVPITEFELEYTHRQTGADDTQTSSFTITGLPALQPGESYSINYSASVDFDTVNSPSGYISVSNEATAQDDSQTASANSNVEISRRMVHKEADANEGTGNVRWTVILNEDGRDLSGRTFRDEMAYTLNGNALAYDLADIANLRVTAYEINDAGQQVSKGDVTAAFEGLIDVMDNAMTVAFPAAGGWPAGLGSHWVYEIVYETPFPEDAGIGEQIAFTNTARLDEYYVTVNWNSTIPEPGYGVVKRSTGQDLNTGTDVGTINWESTISYPSAGFELENMQYMDWMPDAYYDEGGKFIPGSHYTTAATLRDTLRIKNAAGQELVWGEDFNVSVVYAEDMPEYDTIQTAWGNTQTIFGQDLTPLTDGADPDKPIALFCITFTQASQTKLEGGQRLHISYRTLLNRQGVTAGMPVKIRNVGAIRGQTVQVELETAVHEQLQKQVSTTSMAPSGDDFDLDSGVYVDGPVNIDLGDTGGKLYYRILFYNYGDEISFHDDMLEQFNGKFTFDQQMRIYNVITGEARTVKTWDYLESSGRYQGNYTLKNLDQYKDCIIGLYYSIDVSGDPALAELGDGETLSYTNTVEWTGVDEDSTTAHVTNSEVTLKKENTVQNLDTGETLVYYYVTVNPESRDLHPDSDELELRDTLTLSAGASAALRLETIKLYHYDPNNPDGHYLGEEVTQDEFGGFEVVKTEGTANSYTFTLPDEMACVVAYAYEIDQGTSALDEIQVNNTASLLGRAVITAGDQIQIAVQESGGRVNRATLTIYKIGGGNYANRLQDVLFDLFRYEQQEDGSYAWVRTDLTAEGPVADDGGRHFITGGDGVEGAIILNFLDEREEGQNSYYNVLYRLTEFRSIDGYELDPTPRYYVWGEYNKTAEQTAAEMADALAEANVDWDQVTFIPFGQSMTETINNEPLTTSITAAKRWQNMNGEELTPEELPENITLTLYQHIDGSKAQYGDTVTVTPDENGNWTYTWEKLPRKDDTGNYYTYSVEETAVDGYETSYRYPEGGGNAETGIDKGEIIITNTKIVSFILPETGGAGSTPFIIAGLLLVGMSGVGCLYIRRKRQKGGYTH
ncbi:MULTISPECIES: Cna B-type domain-containing protein [Eubacteriales]|uniref:Cna B-type domain-containing protein n=1 Tax=Bittarella massiliensis (ex Durand et al. 2017) TaxID=1720313 RepID=A0AAQ1MDC7_9FIRM|nr:MULTISPECIES: Cna B-type domain-containing protein [Eubacteriales]MZL69079.1 Cna B-type domain-containing protein [Bittarella massiliensis (ex Durand et al. 2017)]SHG11475.1 LPXTG-motif cell wall anchor domain-containing protein [Bittarella massiliensis (ex Durand et al. 2017)]